MRKSRPNEVLLDVRLGDARERDVGIEVELREQLVRARHGARDGVLGPALDRGGDAAEQVGACGGASSGRRTVATRSKPSPWDGSSRRARSTGTPVASRHCASKVATVAAAAVARATRTGRRVPL